eukprot:scaffold78748_cov17-Prasinocladus_malaysianus.AAC.3
MADVLAYFRRQHTGNKDKPKMLAAKTPEMAKLVVEEFIDECKGLVAGARHQLHTDMRRILTDALSMLEAPSIPTQARADQPAGQAILLSEEIIKKCARAKVVSDKLGWTERPSNPQVAKQLEEFAAMPLPDEQGDDDDDEVVEIEPEEADPEDEGSGSQGNAAGDDVHATGQGKKRRDSTQTLPDSTPLKRAKPNEIFGDRPCSNPNLNHMVRMCGNKRKDKMFRPKKQGHNGLLCSDCHEYLLANGSHRPASMVAKSVVSDFMKFVEEQPVNAPGIGPYHDSCNECGAQDGQKLACCSFPLCPRTCCAQCGACLESGAAWYCKRHRDQQ